MLQPGESREVTFDITTAQLKFYNNDLVYNWEPGQFVIQVGTNSANVHTAAVNWVK